MWKFLIKAGVSVLLLALLLRGLDPGELLQKMLTVDRSALIAAVVCYWAVCIPSALRWSIVLRAMGYERPFRVTFPIVLIGYFFNLTLVSAVGGDAVRMWEINRSGLPPAPAFISVAIDRLIQYFAHILIVVAALPASFQLVPDPALRRGLLLFVTASALGLVVATLLDRLPLAKLRFRLAGVLGQFSADLRRIVLVPSRAVSTVFLGLCNQCGVVLVVIILAWGLALPVTWLQCVVIVPLSLLATAIPISIGGWGVRESAFVTGFGLVGVSASDALVLSVLFGILNLLVRLPGGLVWLTASSPSAARLRERSD
jgi:glycosyltransferase 2 family protein